MSAPGGFVELATTATIRPALTQLPLPERGPFVFPAPYRTQGIRVTTGADCGGHDAVEPHGYSYWRQINNHAGAPTLLVLATFYRARGGQGPAIFRVTKATGAVEPLGPLFPPDHPLSWETGEGWYFSATRPTILYVNNRRYLCRVDVLTKVLEVVFDLWAWAPGAVLWQPHTSADDRVHSATYKDGGTYAPVGAVVYREGGLGATLYPRVGAYDECQVDKAGAWLLIKENLDATHGEDNRIISLHTGVERRLLDAQGAAGHSDNGHGYMVAADNWAPQPNAIRLWAFDGGAPQGRLVYHTPTWAADLGHLSHGNARPGPPEDQWVLGGTASRIAAPRNNELVAFRLDGALEVAVCAPVLTDLDAPGGGTDDYRKQPKGCLDPTGEYFAWTANLGGPRLDLFLLQVPTQWVGDTPPPPDPGPTPPGPGVPVVWASVIQAVADAWGVRKVGGWDGVDDAGALGYRQAALADLTLVVTATETTTLRSVGWSLLPMPSLRTAHLSYSLSFQEWGAVEVRELGAYRTDRAYAPGDVFGIELRDRCALYTKNGLEFYRSRKAPLAPRTATPVVSLRTLGATVGPVRLVVGGAQAPQ